jgi:SP family general alpha glucoside:H+ symporter-like MFS transporter
MIQIFCGQPFGGVGAYFFEAAGFPPERAFSLQLGVTAIAFVGTVTSWVLMRLVGRRTLYVYGLAAMFALLLAIGILGIPRVAPGLSWATGSLMFLFVFVFDITVGPVCYPLVAEMPATRLRNKSVILARCSYNVAGIIGNIINPRILNPSA